MARLSGQC
jgi:hypothetical protein